MAVATYSRQCSFAMARILYWLRNRRVTQTVLFRQTRRLLTIVVVFEVAVVVTITVVVVTYLTVLAIPITCEVLLPIMVGLHPMCAGIGWTRPVSVVPLVMPAYGIPVAANPRVAFARASRLNMDDAYWRWRPDSDSHRKLREQSSPCQ